MITPNTHYADLKDSYLFYNIAQKTKAYLAANPDKHLYRMGIGDVSLPLCDAVIRALHEAVDDQAKKEKEARKKQKTVDVKELRLSPSIDTHDVQVKVKKANEFLKDGDKVKISIRFRGREIGHSKVGMQIMEDFAKATSELGVVDKPAKMEGKSLVMFLAPKN